MFMCWPHLAESSIVRDNNTSLERPTTQTNIKIIQVSRDIKTLPSRKIQIFTTNDWPAWEYSRHQRKHKKILSSDTIKRRNVFDVVKKKKKKAHLKEESEMMLPTEKKSNRLFLKTLQSLSGNHEFCTESSITCPTYRVHTLGRLERLWLIIWKWGRWVTFCTVSKLLKPNDFIFQVLSHTHRKQARLFYPSKAP